MPPIRVLVVDDSAVICRLLADVLVGDPGLQVVGSAVNGRVGLAKIVELRPDIVTLDIQMPIMDGLEMLKEIRRLYPKLPVIMFSTLTGRGGAATLDALALGASDYVAKPGLGVAPSEVVEHVRRELIPKIKSLAGIQSIPCVQSKPKSAARLQRSIDIVAIGVSTGGPNALTELLPKLPADFPVPIVIVQHMPAVFTHMLAERLNTLSALEIREGKLGELLHPGNVWIAPGGFHMAVRSQRANRALMLHQEPPENSCRPSVDVLFRSVAEVYGNHVLGVVLSGMGADGAAGAKVIREAGGEVWAQDQSTSVVWGMPGSVVAGGYADQVFPLQQIGRELVARASFGRQSARLQPAFHASPTEAHS